MSAREPFFSGLVFNEEGDPAKVTHIGGEPFYAVPDGDFLRHVEASTVDRQVIASIKEWLLSMKDTVVEGVVQFTGSDDPFSRAAIEMSLENMDQILDLPPEAGNVGDLRLGLWMSGFRVVVDVHGDVMRIDMPGMQEPD